MGAPLSKLGGVEDARQLVSEYAGIVVGVNLRRLREVVETIEATPWEEHDTGWLPGPFLGP